MRRAESQVTFHFGKGSGLCNCQDAKGSILNKAERTAQEERGIQVNGRVQEIYHGRKPLLKAAEEGREDSS